MHWRASLREDGNVPARRLIRIAAFNVENMFRRPRVFEHHDPKVLAAYTRLTTLLEQSSYEGVEDEILENLDVLKLKNVDEASFAVMRKIRGSLLRRRRKPKRVELAAKGRADWIGWVELKRRELRSKNTYNTAGVIADVNPDVLAVVEIEDRMALERFNQYVLRKFTKDEQKRAKKDGREADEPWSFEHSMLIDGNDERGIDVGVMAKPGFEIDGVRSHVDDWKEPGDPTSGRVFSRDCAEYEIALPGGDRLLLLVNHFKSKIGGGGDRREEQAERVAEIYEERRREKVKRIVVAGDLNDTPESGPLAPLIQGTNLRDAGSHPDFDWGGPKRGTYGFGKNQFDYLLLSPDLFRAFDAGRVNRRGIWRKSHVGKPELMLPTMKKELDAASDHAAISVDVAL
jgi:endonuclease/exonuclease/phosphatase family metal-dependent hydrolase